MRIDMNELARTGQIRAVAPRPKTAIEIFQEVKRKRGDLIRAHKVTDTELMELVTNVKSGIRNVMYLTNIDNRKRLQDLAVYVLREHSY